MENPSIQTLFQLPHSQCWEEDDFQTTGYVFRGALMVRLTAYILTAMCIVACGMGDACEELAEARCGCDDSMCDDAEANIETDDKRTQACKEELEAFTCETE